MYPTIGHTIYTHIRNHFWQLLRPHGMRDSLYLSVLALIRGYLLHDRNGYGTFLIAGKTWFSLCVDFFMSLKYFYLLEKVTEAKNMSARMRVCGCRGGGGVKRP